VLRCRRSPRPHRGPEAYPDFVDNAAVLVVRIELTGAARRVVPTRANNQPAFGVYLRDPQCAVARAYGIDRSHAKTGWPIHGA
jgi:hypothetical protein